MPPRFILLLASLVVTSCASSQCARNSATTSTTKEEAKGGGSPVATAPVTTGPSTTAAAVPAGSGAAGDAAPAPTPTKKRPTPHEAYVAWLKERVPAGDEVIDRGDAVDVMHTVKRGEIPANLAHAYLPISDVYFESDFATEIAKSARKEHKETGFAPGKTVRVPHLWPEPFKSADDERLPWPEDHAMRGLYIRGGTAVRPFFAHILEQMTKRDINAIVLDAKDYDGPVTYVSKVPLAVETGANKAASIRDLSRVIRFVHAKGIHVIMRISCFNDEFMAHARPDLIPLSKWGKPYQIGWLNPNNETAQNYILDLVKESLDAGADEIQLDYVRYPVLGIKGADFQLEAAHKTKIEVIHGFVQRAHAITQARHVPLSLDLFGVVAQGKRDDIEMLGQDMAVLAPDAEAFSPMVYPSHYANGFMGWDNPGDHPEIVGIGVKGSLEQIAAAPKDKPLAVIRPWMQAMDYKTTTYSPKYLQDEIRASNENGGVGWLMWNPSQEYGFAWAAVPPKATPQPPKPTASN